eukprot:scaffold130479_cov18-Tisochrysis_lutea.AAC.1
MSVIMLSELMQSQKLYPSSLTSKSSSNSSSSSMPSGSCIGSMSNCEHQTGGILGIVSMYEWRGRGQRDGNKQRKEGS